MIKYSVGIWRIFVAFDYISINKHCTVKPLAVSP